MQDFGDRCPSCRARGPEIGGRLHRLRVVQRHAFNEDHIRHHLGFGEQRRPTAWAEQSSDPSIARGSYAEARGCAFEQLEVVAWNREDGCESTAGRLLAIATVAIGYQRGFYVEPVPDRSTQTAACYC